MKNEGTVGAVEEKDSSDDPELDQVELEVVKTWCFNLTIVEDK